MLRYWIRAEGWPLVLARGSVAWVLALALASASASASVLAQVLVHPLLELKEISAFERNREETAWPPPWLAAPPEA